MTQEPIQPLYAEPEHVERIEECVFYHVMDIPGVGVVGPKLGARNGWDLRGHVDAYLGHVNLDGRRVLEIGPANGFLTFEMESRGADVVAVEIGPHSQWDLVPDVHFDPEVLRADRRDMLDQLRKAFWFGHERLGSRARVHYGNANRLPDALGTFDTAVLAAVLLHNRDPLGMVDQCARRADEIVITERHWPELDDAIPLARLRPSVADPQPHTWWDFTPSVFTAYLQVLGFDRPVLTFHEQTHVWPTGQAQMPMFTVVARRP